MDPQDSFQWVDSCGSTSKALKEQLKGDFSTFQALGAGSQTGGVGQMGRSWESPTGNLFLSLGVPSSYLKGASSLLPHVSGAIVARWLELKTLTRITLKWPNDLLLDGKKIGGILCEGLYQGSSLQGVIIGIGINLTTSIQGQVEYPTGTVKDLTRVSLDPRTSAQELAAFFLEELRQSSPETLFSRWKSYGIGAGHGWCEPSDGKLKCWVQEEFPVSGELRLRSLLDEAPQTKTVTSGTGNYRWSMLQHKPWLVADVGNSRIKLALVERNHKGDVTIKETHQVLDDHSLGEFLGGVTAADVLPLIHTISVNPEGLTQFSKVAAQHGFFVRTLGKRSVRNLRSQYHLAQIGMDRFTCLEGALFLKMRRAENQPILLVSWGTATTVDALSGDHQHLGGYILPGIANTIHGATSRGALLPKDLQPNFQFPEGLLSWPTHTQAALQQGAVEQALAFVDHLKEKLTRCEGFTMTALPPALRCSFTRVNSASVLGQRLVLAKPSHHIKLALKEQKSLDDVLVIFCGGFAENMASLCQGRHRHFLLEPSLGLLGAAVLGVNGA